MTVLLDWLGCATFRVQAGDLVIFLDAFMDRSAKAPPVGLTTAQVDRADWILVGHSHWDHLWGAETIARNTGATIVGSHETVRVMAEQGVSEPQLMAVSGGERIRLADGVSARVLPSLHSCIWARSSARADEVCIGDLGLSVQEQRARPTEPTAARAPRDPTVPPRWASERPRGDGGALAYLIDTPDGSVLFKDTMGHWTGILRDVRADVALLAAVGRPNVDGEPIQGSIAQFIAREAELVDPRRIVLNHHDDWAGRGAPLLDSVAPIREELARRSPRTELIEMGYRQSYPILRGISDVRRSARRAVKL